MFKLRLCWLDSVICLPVHHAMQDGSRIGTWFKIHKRLISLYFASLSGHGTLAQTSTEDKATQCSFETYFCLAWLYTATQTRAPWRAWRSWEVIDSKPSVEILWIIRKISGKNRQTQFYKWPFRLRKNPRHLFSDEFLILETFIGIKTRGGGTKTL